jgi:RNA polymerase sigma-70 factor (ECF subfamily)
MPRSHPVASPVGSLASALTRPLITRAVRSPATDEAWLNGFHRGERAALARCYEDYVDTVTWAVRPIARGVDEETVVHDVFCRLFANEQARRSFTGGNFGAWIITVARRQAIDFRRRFHREQLTDSAEVHELAARAAPPDDRQEELERNLWIGRFRDHVLPAKWAPVFRARFMEQLDQREAARRLGMHRTTLAYQEMRIRALLKKFVLEDEG